MSASARGYGDRVPVEEGDWVSFRNDNDELVIGQVVGGSTWDSNVIPYHPYALRMIEVEGSADLLAHIVLVGGVIVICAVFGIAVGKTLVMFYDFVTHAWSLAKTKTQDKT